MTHTDRPASFDARLMSYMPALAAMSRRFTTPEKRDDLVQDTITYALKNWRGFREDGGFYKWLGYIMYWLANKHRRRTCAIQYVEDPDGLIANTHGVTGGQHERLELLDALRILDKKPAYRDACLEIAITGTSHAAAEREGLTPQAICTRAIRGRAMLMEATNG